MDEDLKQLRGYLFIVVSEVSFWLRWFAAYEIEDEIWKVALKRPEASGVAPPEQYRIWSSQQHYISGAEKQWAISRSSLQNPNM